MLQTSALVKIRTRAQALIEFAAALPVFVLILVGVVEFGRMVYTKHILDKATREGVRAGIVEVDPDDAVATAETVCRNVLASLNITNPKYVGAQVLKVNNADAVTLTATQTFQSFFSQGMFSIIPAVDLTSSATMRKEG